MGGAVLLALGLLAWRQAHVYHDAETIWRDTLAKDPDSSMAHINLGMLLSRWEDAAVALLEALAIRPDDPAVMSRLVEVYRRRDAGGGRVRLDTNDPVVCRDRCAAYRELARIYAEARESDAAAEARRHGEAICAAS